MAPRDPEASKAKLLEAARHEFSAKGIAGARVDAIAARAGVNKQLVYYHFGSKDGLYRALLHDRLARPRDLSGDADPTTGERLAAAMADLAAEPDYIRLLMWEALGAGAHGEVGEEEARREVYEALVATVRDAQAAGTVDPELDPAQVLLSRIAQVIFPFAFPQLTRLITGRSADDPAFVEARARFLVDAYR
jgi:AcrR family transcriptional regulator